MIDLFREWDEDGDGTVTKKEFRKAIAHLGLHAPPHVVDEVRAARRPRRSNTRRGAPLLPRRERIDPPAAAPARGPERVGLGPAAHRRRAMRRAASPRRPPPPARRGAQLFDSFDSDGGGAVSFRELNSMLRRNVKKEKKVVRQEHHVPLVDVEKARRLCSERMGSLLPSL